MTSSVPPSSSSSSMHKDSSHDDADDMLQPPEQISMSDQEELNAASSEDQGDSGKLKTLMGVLKRMVGVKDMAAMRLSLPANLLEPVPNLEYWNYLDRGDIFASIGELEDPLDRMLQALRFTFTTELKFVHGKICKPYNSILGEHFRCHWDVEGLHTNENGQLVPVQGLRSDKPAPMALAGGIGGTAQKKTSTTTTTTSSGASRPPSIKGSSNNSSNTSTSTSAAPDSSETSGIKKKVPSLSRFLSKDKTSKSSASTSSSANTAAPVASSASSTKGSTKSPALSATAGDSDLGAGMEKLSLSQPSGLKGGQRRITFITEQVCHHPPISSFFVECKDTGVELCGVDQLSAKFTGTSIRVFPGEMNKGIFVKLTEDVPVSSAAGEEYQITHPTASINGLLRGSLWAAICDSMTVTCRGSQAGKRLRTIVEYKDESWLTKAKYALDGIVYEYDHDVNDADDAAEEYKTIKSVPSDKIVAVIEGSWKGKISWKRKGDKESHLLVDLNDLNPLPKTVRPLSVQDSMESRKIWHSVTSSILSKQYPLATKNKQKIEQAQREIAADRKRKGEEFKPRFFEEDISTGRPALSYEGRKAVDAERELEGYGKGDNVPESTPELASKAATGGSEGLSAGHSGSARKDELKKQGQEGGDDGDDDDDDEDASSFRSAEG